MKRETVLRHNLNRVINYVHSNCGTSIGLEQMADVACLSKFHFSRVFQNYVHESPYRYLYRTRLEYAARSLSYHPDKSITSLAMDCGFNDLQALSNAFRQRFKLSPTQFRSSNQWVFDGFDKPGLLLNEMEKQQVKIVNKPALRLAYIRRFGSYTNNNGAIPKTFSMIVDWAKSRGLWTENTPCIGLCPNNPALTPPQSCIFDAGIPVSKEIEEDEQVGIQSIPAGRYAVLNIACSPHQFNQVWKWLAFKWLQQSGETYAMEHCYEMYYPRHHGIIAPQLGVELCLRLLPHPG